MNIGHSMLEVLAYSEENSVTKPLVFDLRQQRPGSAVADLQHTPRVGVAAQVQAERNQSVVTQIGVP
jgi:hypothetical protein